VTQGVEAPTRSPLRAFVAASASLGVLSLIRLLVGFGRTKFIAIAFGATGVGLLAQGNQLFLLGVTVGSAGLSTGVIRRLATIGLDSDRDEERRALIGTSTVLHLVAAMAFTIVVVALAGPLTGVVFGPNGTVLMLIVSVVAVPLNTIASGHLEGIMFGLGRYDLYTRAAAAATLIGLPAVIGLGLIGGLIGAFYGTALGAAAYLVTYLFEMRRLAPPLSFLRFRFSRSAAASLLNYSVATVATTTAATVALLVVRSVLIHAHGDRAAGLYQIPIALTAYYTPFLTNGMWARLYPAASGAGPAAARAELVAALRVTVAGCTVAVVGILAAAEVIIRVAYSRDFLPAKNLLCLQLLGDLPFFALTATGMYLLAVGRLRLYVASWMAFYLSYVAITIGLIDHFGTSAAAIAYTTAAWAVGGGVVVVTLLFEDFRERRPLLVAAAFSTVAIVLTSIGAYGDRAVIWRAPGVLLLAAVSAAALLPYIRRRRAQGGATLR
jgi:O-antigen/teichoic acid export membrane protein